MSRPATIASILAWEALDSRGTPTVGCRVELAGGGAGRAIAPSGASTGGYEAHEKRDGGERYSGKGVLDAVAAVRDTIAPALLGADADDRAGIDRTMEQLDGTHALERLGANAVLAVSLATMLAAADHRREPLWRMLSGEDAPLLPMPMVNILSGGAHAGQAVDLQDVLAVPVGATSFAEAIEWAARVRRATADVLVERGGSVALIADEGGLAAALGGNEQAFALVTDGIHRSGLEPGRDVQIAVDFAADQFSRPDGYHLDADDTVLTAPEWADLVHDWCERYPVCSVEDVLQEDDWAGWASFTAANPHLQVIGDDLFATNRDRLVRGIDEQAANAVLVKPNQAGTVTRAERVMEIARRAGFATVVSARSGDTEDPWLADVAVGWNAGQIKVGSTMRSERTAKWNRLLEIEARAGSAARFAGREALTGRGSPPPQ